MFAGLHHVQLAVPAGEEEQARAFFADVLGMTEIAKRPVLATRGGAWFRRFYAHDPFGNRLEFLEPAERTGTSST